MIMKLLWSWQLWMNLIKHIINLLDSANYQSDYHSTFIEITTQKPEGYPIRSRLNTDKSTATLNKEWRAKMLSSTRFSQYILQHRLSRLQQAKRRKLGNWKIRDPLQWTKGNPQREPCALHKIDANHLIFSSYQLLSQRNLKKYEDYTPTKCTE